VITMPWSPDPSTPVYIVCAARKEPSGRIVIGARHNDEIMRSQYSEAKAMREFPPEDGFIDQFCRFWTRTEAWKIAEKSGQIRNRCGGDTYEGGTLFSENLY